jgi:hypothetical protein
MKKTYITGKILLILTVFLVFAMKNAPADPLVKPTLNTIFQPILADPLQPRIAVMPWTSDKYLQLDIGTSADLYQSRNKDFAVGIDFGTFSLLRCSDNFKFPVDTIDYLFGVNASMTKPIQSTLPFDTFSAKLRLSHISAHFEDGHTDASGHWIQGDCPFTIPFVYSREFLNLVLALSSKGNRIYAGYQYMYHSSPDGINPHSFQAGAELSTPGDTYLAADFKLLPAWDASFNETRGFRGTWNLQAGMRLGSIGLEKVRVAYNYSSGLSRQGMYFYRPESFSTVGVIVDL